MASWRYKASKSWLTIVQAMIPNDWWPLWLSPRKEHHLPDNLTRLWHQNIYMKWYPAQNVRIPKHELIRDSHSSNMLDCISPFMVQFSLICVCLLNMVSQVVAYIAWNSGQLLLNKIFTAYMHRRRQTHVLSNNSCVVFLFIVWLSTIN